MSDDLTEFLLARIAEDEAVARAATRGPWLYDGGGIYAPEERTATRALFREDVVYDDDCGIGVAAHNAAHIARHDPARVLAECKAKRRIMEGARGAGGDGRLQPAERPRLPREGLLLCGVRMVRGGHWMHDHTGARRAVRRPPGLPQGVAGETARDGAWWLVIPLLSTSLWLRWVPPIARPREV